VIAVMFDLKKFHFSFFILVAILLLGFGLRLSLALQSGAGYSDDSHWYMTLAQNLATGKGYTLFGVEHDRYPPGYPGLIILFSAVFPNYEDAGKYAALIFGTLSILLIFLLGRQLFDEKAGLFAAAIFSVLPLAVNYSILQLSDAPFLFFYLLSLLFFFKALEKPKLNLFLFFVFAGIATLIRTNGLIDFFPPLVLIFAWLFFFNREKFQNLLSKLPFAFLGFLITYGLFALRNLLVFGSLFSGYVADNQKNTGQIYFQYLLDIPLEITIPVFALFLFSLFVVNWKDDKVKFFAFFTLPHIAFLMAWWGYDIRLMLNVLPFFAIFAGFGLVELLKKLGLSRQRFFYLAMALFLIFPIVNMALKYDEFSMNSNRLLPLKQAAQFLNASIGNDELAIVGDVNIYGFQMGGKKIMDARAFPAFPQSLEGMVQVNAKYITLDNGVSYCYSDRFDFLNNKNFSIQNKLGPVEFDAPIGSGNYRFKFTPIKRFEYGLTFSQVYKIDYSQIG